MRSPKGMRLHIGIFGRRNVGKSSLLNALTRQQVSIVSEVAGTTTDPVEKPMELLPLGPVLFIDTAGLDDTGTLGEQRMEKTRRIFERTDVGIIVTAAGEYGAFEEDLVLEMERRQIPLLVVFNQSDRGLPSEGVLQQLSTRKIPVLQTVASRGEGLLELRQALIRLAPEDFINPPSILADLVAPGEMAVLVVPIDKEAPKGRLILPQVQSIRDLLDHDCLCLVTKEHQLRESLQRLTRKPALVVTDSQAFRKVAKDTPADVPLTSFSILFARYKGDLDELVRGTMAIEALRPGDRVLIAEACTHHPIGEDIGRVKIPSWLNQYVGGALVFDTTAGHDFPKDLAPYRLVIHCGACMWNRREMLSRMLACREASVPISNYGLTIAYSLGVFERALAPFPAAQRIVQSMKGRAHQKRDAKPI